MPTPINHRPTRLVWPVLAGLIVVVDQLSKALAPHAWCVFDPGTGTLWPWAVSRAFENPFAGAALDMGGCAVLCILVLLASRRARRPLTLAGLAVLFGGLSSNLLDRLGLAHLTQGVEGRQVVNWFNVGLWRVNVGNVADCCYVVGCLVLLASALLFAAGLVRARWATPAAPVLTLVREPAPEGVLAGTGESIRRSA